MAAKGHVVMDWTDPSNGALTPETRAELHRLGFKFNPAGELMSMRRVTPKGKGAEETRVPKVFLVEVPPGCAFVMVTERGPEWTTKFHGRPEESAPRAASKRGKTLAEAQAEATVVRSKSQGIGEIK